MEETELAAVARAQAGDSDAFRVLVERHGRSVFRLAFRMTGNEQDAEDIVQETFLRAYKQLNRYENRAGFGTWLYRIAANYSLDFLRSRKSKHNESGDEMLAAVASPSPGPERTLLSGQVQVCVEQALSELSQQERTAFVLRHYEGLSIEEISGALGLSGNAAKHSIFRAVQKLRKMLEPLVGAR